MKKISILTLGLLFAVACSNDNDNIVKRLAQEPATVREVKGANNLFVLDLSNTNNGLYSQYIVPNGALPAEYKQDGLSAFISGNVTNNTVAINGYILDDIGNSVILNGIYNTFDVKTMSESIPFEEYSLKETSCRWLNSTPLNGEQIITINNDEELASYINCTDGSYTAIDFSKHTLLLIRGYLPSSGAGVTNTVFYKDSINKYTLNLTVFKGVLATPGIWYFAIRTAKITNEATVALHVTYW